MDGYALARLCGFRLLRKVPYVWLNRIKTSRRVSNYKYTTADLWYILEMREMAAHPTEEMRIYWYASSTRELVTETTKETMKQIRPTHRESCRPS